MISAKESTVASGITVSGAGIGEFLQNILSDRKKRSTKFQRLDLEDNCFFFRAQAVQEALRKDRDCPVEKETPKRRGASGREEAQPPPLDVESWSSSQC